MSGNIEFSGLMTFLEYIHRNRALHCNQLNIIPPSRLAKSGVRMLTTAAPVLNACSIWRRAFFRRHIGYDTKTIANDP